MAPPPLPIDAHLDAIRAALRLSGAVVIVAPPGAGKTTRVPPNLARDSRVILLQPRRVAARALARRIASEQGWTLGEQVGWQVRFERRFTRQTRLLVATEGILTARLQDDPLLSDFDAVIIDEFHERSLHADLALALTKQARSARPGLRVVVMSATLDAGPVARYLGDCPTLTVEGRLHPVTIDYAPQLSVVDATIAALARPGGHILCFLPGAGEIRRAQAELVSRLPHGVRALALHGSLDSEEQDAALAPCAERKVILATNIAETSLTVDGVTTVVDGGQHKVTRCDYDRGLSRLELERISLDSADQRAGRAGRTAPGWVVRLWDPRERLRERREPEIARADLTAPLLDVFAWGGDPASFDWFDPPNPERMRSALDLLERLGLVRTDRLSALGRRVHRLPLHPRLACVLAAAGATERAARACVLLSERVPRVQQQLTTVSDVLTGVDAWADWPAPLKAIARELHVLARRQLPPDRPDESDELLLRALLAGYPDRVARRRAPGSPRLLLASGHGATLARESGVRDAEWVVALDVESGARGPRSEALVRLASAIDSGWLSAERVAVEHEFDEGSSTVRAIERELYGQLVLRERPTTPDPEQAVALLLAACERRGLDPAAQTLAWRLAFARLDVDLRDLLRDALTGRVRLPKVDVAPLLSGSVRQALSRLAPETIAVPSGRSLRLDYRPDGSVHLAVKLQELFGLAETPRIGPERTPLVLELLAPNGRPVQTTRDLRSFWERTYPDVRKELRGRYPKHPWPEDPWSAKPTARAKPRRRAP
jgi:ATP-dependent helicase HrpB